MSDGCVISEQQLCGCCAGVGDETPQVITNRPALSSIAYRAGTYCTFKASMLAALSDPAFPLLALLRTRNTSDFSVALIDSWAVALDILTFYQERFANEAFLRTAVDQRSVFELARLVGYVPSPGVSASAVLAFTLSSAAGSPDNVLISAGTRVQSVPGPGQTPQVFETSSDLVAVIACNAIPAQTTIPWQIFGSDMSTWIQGTTNSINVGDALLFLTAQSGRPVANGPGDVHYVTAVSTDPISGNTQIFWDQPLSSSFKADMKAEDVSIFIFRKKAALYGVQAPNPLTLGSRTSNLIPGYPTHPGPGSDWEFQYQGNHQINLDASYPGLAPQANSAPSLIVLTGPGHTSYFQIMHAVDSNPVPGLYTLTAKTTQLTLCWGRILIEQRRYTLTAETTQFTLDRGRILSGDTRLLPNEVLKLSPNALLNEVLSNFVQNTRSITAYVQSVQLPQANLPLAAANLSPTNLNVTITVPLATGTIVPVQGTSISIVGGQQIAANQPIGITGKRARLQVTNCSDASFVPANSSGTLPVADNQIFLATGFPPATDPTTGNPSWTVLTLAGISGALSVAAGNMQLMPADKNDPYTGEAALVNATGVNGDITELSLTNSLSGIYDATTVTVNANSVEATNGETVQEILGSGDATNNALEFTLKQPPLTYVSSPTGNGSQSTLQIWVNNLRWREVSNLLSSGPADRVFVTRADSQGNTIVRFGNGVQGACTPTGQSNIRAVYRKGIGSTGMVNAGQLSQPLDRPQGLKSVVNPGAASGAADPASAADARASASLPTLTIGRVVSLEDYQNFALAFPGIAKAIVTWTWFGNLRGVFLTVAGENGATLQNSDPIVTDLIKAIQSAGNPYIPLLVASYVPVLFQFTANVKIDATDYNPKQVLAQVWRNISVEFAFDRRQLAQKVVAGEIIEIIQQTPGVVAVQLTALNPSGVPVSGSVPAMLCASGPLPPQGAQMLLLDPQTQGNIGVWS
jgi:hypothetical protein